MKKSDRIPPGRATGIGSLPFATMDDAVRHVERVYSDFLFVPEVGGDDLRPLVLSAVMPPKLAAAVSPRGTDCPLVAHDEELLRMFDVDDRALRDAAITARVGAALERFTALADRALKIQMLGPCTLLCAMRDGLHQPLWHESRLRERSARWIGALGRSLVESARARGANVYLQIDEPMLGHLDFDAEAAAETLNAAIRTIRGTEARVGVHSCSKPSFAVIEKIPLDFLSLDVDRYGEEIAAEAPRLARAMEGAFFMAGSVAITSLEDRSPVSALLKIAAAMPSADRVRFMRSIVFTPSCGTLLAPVARESEIAAALSRFADEWRLVLEAEGMNHE